ncbi:MAG: metallophosphoesterase [Opitutales bacterium]
MSVETDFKKELAEDFKDLEERIGAPHLRQRLSIEVLHASEVFGRHGQNFFHIENLEILHSLIRLVLKGTGAYSWGRRNFKNIRIVSNEVHLPRLPAAFDGFTICQLSDLHLDLDEDFADTVIEKVKDLRYDRCVVTGDFRSKTHGPSADALRLTAKIIPYLKSSPLGILGNHDFIEMVPGLEDAGLRILLNETTSIEKDGEALFIAGIDDPHFYETDNIQKVRAAIPMGCFSLLLAHSPEVYRKAHASGFDFMLSGHTHGGQICLPGGIPIIHNGKCPRRMIRGAWSHHNLQGYTSPGTGSCGVPARFFCPPEITLHTLKRGRSSEEV